MKVYYDNRVLNFGDKIKDDKITLKFQLVEASKTKLKKRTSRQTEKLHKGVMKEDEDFYNDGVEHNPLGISFGFMWNLGTNRTGRKIRFNSLRGYLKKQKVYKGRSTYSY